MIATALSAIVALLACAAATLLAAIVYYRLRIRRVHRDNPGLARAMRIRAKYRRQG